MTAIAAAWSFGATPTVNLQPLKVAQCLRWLWKLALWTDLFFFKLNIKIPFVTRKTSLTPGEGSLGNLMRSDLLQKRRWWKCVSELFWVYQEELPGRVSFRSHGRIFDGFWQSGWGNPCNIPPLERFQSEASPWTKKDVSLKIKRSLRRNHFSHSVRFL